MPARSIFRGPTPVGIATAKGAPIYVDSDDNRLKSIPAGSGSTEVIVADSNKAVVTSPTGELGFDTGAGGAVTQITSAATGVTLSKPTGQITTVALTTAAAAEEEFIVTNTLVEATDIIVLSTTYAGAGTPILAVKAVGAGVFTIVITNVHAANALNALMVINFAVIKGASA